MVKWEANADSASVPADQMTLNQFVVRAKRASMHFQEIYN